MNSLIQKLQTQGAQDTIEPFMLMSYINMKLRDDYASLDLLCDDLDVERAVVEKVLASAGFEYNETANKFW